MPNDSSIILTTRDRRVAFDLECGDGPIQPVEGLSMEEVVTLLQVKASSLPAKKCGPRLGWTKIVYGVLLI